jgi:hypothetical protein
MKLNSTFIPVMGRIDGKFSERPMALDLSKVEFFIPSTPWGGDEKATDSCEEITAVLESGTQVIFRVKGKKGNFLTFEKFKSEIGRLQISPETILVDNPDSKVAGKKPFIVRS